jgi:hypothetical protein
VRTRSAYIGDHRCACDLGGKCSHVAESGLLVHVRGETRKAAQGLSWSQVVPGEMGKDLTLSYTYTF